jgi:hypothetical protein
MLNILFVMLINIILFIGPHVTRLYVSRVFSQ